MADAVLRFSKYHRRWQLEFNWGVSYFCEISRLFSSDQLCVELSAILCVADYWSPNYCEHDYNGCFFQQDIVSAFDVILYSRTRAEFASQS